MFKHNNKQKIFLFIFIIGMGDVVVASQACQDIKRYCKNSKIIFIVPEFLKQTAFGIKEVDEVYGFDKKGRHKGFWGMIKFLFEFKHKGRIDYSFSTFGGDRALSLAFLLGVKEKHTYIPSDFIMHFEKLWNMKIHHVDNSTTAAEDLQNWAVNILSEKPCSNKIKFDYPKEADNTLLEKLSVINATKFPLIALCPCSSEREKDWKVENISELIEASYNDGKRIVLVGSNKDKWIESEIKKSTKKQFFSLMGKTDIFEIAALAHKAEIFVSVDTGPMHVSYASGAKTLCMFLRSRDFYKWAPRGYENTLILHRPEGISGHECYSFIKKLIAKNS